jgi:uncharacterized membrane protein (UPF0127 family)
MTGTCGPRPRQAGTLRVIALWLLLWLLAFAVHPASAGAQQGLAKFEHDRIVLRTSAGEEHSFDVELALTPQQQAQGLMYRASLARAAGMVFIYRPARRVSMWMRNTAIPLDMLFIAEDGEIVLIAERTVPFSQTTISSGMPVRAVIEINGGTAARLGIGLGDRVMHPAFDSGP